ANTIWELFPPFARYGFNRCLTGETEIIDAETGLPVKIGDLVNNPKLLKKTGTFNDESDLKISIQTVLAVIPNGKKPVFKVRTRSGRQIRSTENHPFYGIRGWQLLEKLKPGDRIAVPRRLPEPEKPLHLPKHKLATLGYLLAEGNFCHPNGFYFYSKSNEEVQDYIKYLEQFKNTVAKTNNSKPAISVYSKRKNLRQPSEAVEWVNATGLRYKKATEKFLPTFMYSLANDDLTVLIAKMFQGDGCINIQRGDPQIFYATSSQKIANGLQRLLLRFGILSTIHKKKFKYRGGIKIGYTVTISRFDNIKKFVENFSKHLVGEKRTTAESIKTSHPIINGSLPAWSARGSKDIIPTILARPLIHAGVTTAGLTFSGFAKTIGIAERLFSNDDQKIGYLRETIGFIGSALKNPEIIKHAKSDIYWDEIVSIEFDGIEETFDLSMETNHNFIANDIFVHNSHAVCYALIGYQTAYLKVHYPVELMTGVLNADSGDIDRIAFLIGETQKMNINILPPDINKSDLSFAPENGNIRFGLAAIKNVGENIVRAIIEERQRSGPFENLASFLSRVQHKDLNKKSLESLIKCGTLDSLGIERKMALENLDEIVKFNSLVKKSRQTSQMGLFGSSVSLKSLKLKPVEPAEMKERLMWEKELLGIYLSEHPLAQYQEKMAKTGIRPIKEVMAGADPSKPYAKFSIGGIVSKIQKITTRFGQPMLFAKVEDLSHTVEVVVFSESLAKNPAVWQENNVVAVTGKMSWRNGEQKLICDEAKLL
ncbi:MAG: LAGLIDADG family homing endonuclease, partial [Patescibacteria group bacterium]